MKAKLGYEAANARYPLDKETTAIRNVAVIHKGDIKVPVTVKWFMGRSRDASVVQCCVWVNGAGVYTSGLGSAGGYGYHKESAAFADALRSANIAVDEGLSGRGDRAIEDALVAIVRALGYRGKVRVI